MLPGRFELPFAASETTALSIELRERIESSDLLLVGSGQCENSVNVEFRVLNFESKRKRFFRVFCFFRSHSILL